MPAPKGNKYAEGNEGGRPTKLTPELLEKAKTYLEYCEKNPVIREKVKTVQSESKLEKSTEREEYPHLPTVAGFAVYLGINKDTVYEWSKEDKEFSDVLANVQTASEEMKWKYGASGTLNANIVRFGLSAIHGYKEKTETDITSKGESVNVLDPKYLELAKKFEDQLKRDEE